MLIVGFFLLILGAELLVRGSSNIAKKFHIPEILIGLTIVAIGTSMPELIITITSAQNNATDLIIGNAIGSNLCNLLLILGIVAIMNPVEIDRETKIIHLPVALFSSIVILLLALGILGSTNNMISRTDGIVLVVFYLLYFIYPIFIECKDISDSIKEDKQKHDIKTGNILLSLFYIIIGVVSLKYGGDFVVDEATAIATRYGISEGVIGLTIIAIGTALPELITSVVAVIKKEDGLAIGNLVGSCLLNSFLVIGVGAIITPLAFTGPFIYNLLLLTFTTLLIIAFCFIGKKNTITKPKGVILLTMYILYTISLFK